jgi:hypothetical protein
MMQLLLATVACNLAETTRCRLRNVEDYRE